VLPASPLLWHFRVRVPGMRTAPRLLILPLLATFLLIAAGDAVRYSGTWASKTNGSGGKVQLVLAGPEAVSESTFSFTINGEEIPCKTKSLKWDGDRFEGAYTFEVEGATIESSLLGKREANKIEGSYKSKAEDGSVVDEGTFEATAPK
jgi:hypothetical protein